MLVYYFVPFIVSNRYLLFWVSNGHNSVTVQNRTHVYMNFFHHKDLGNHLLQLCPKVVKHPVYGVPPNDGLRISPKHGEVDWRNKLRTNSASSWLLLHGYVEMNSQQNTKCSSDVKNWFLKADIKKVVGVKITECNIPYPNICGHGMFPPVLTGSANPMFRYCQCTPCRWPKRTAATCSSKHCTALMDKTPTHALFTQHYISLACWFH